MLVIISCKKETSCEGCIDNKNNKPPIAIAGPDQIITLPTDSVSLDGSNSNDPDGRISSYLWTKISGPSSFNIIKPTDSITKLKTLVAGTYQFELKVIDNGGLSAKDTMQVIVDAVVTPNHPPIANAGADQTITLPTNTIALDGSASTDPENNITTYLWTKISGPASFNIANSDAVQTQLTNLIQGIYQLELKVTDALGLFSKDTMQVIVKEGTVYVSCDNSYRELISAQLIPFETIPAPWPFYAYGYKIVAAGDKMLLVSQYISNGSSSPIYIYDMTNENWSQVELSSPRMDEGIAVLGNKIYFGGGSVIDGNGNASALSTIDIYNSVSNSWSVSSLNQPGFCDAAAAIGDKVLFNCRSDVQIYNTVVNNCATAPLSIGRFAGSATAAGNKVYFAGGFPLTATGGVSDRIDVYDNTTNAWSNFSLIEPKAQLASIAANNKIFWAGGVNSYNTTGNMSSLVEIYDFTTNTSTTTCLFQPNANFQAVVKDNKIVFFIGDSGYNNGLGFNKFDIFDLSTGLWSIGVLPMMITQPAVISHNNTIYVVARTVNGNASTQVWKLEF
jgi:N-acetylneuraminic acid mutarotase